MDKRCWTKCKNYHSWSLGLGGREWCEKLSDHEMYFYRRSQEDCPHYEEGLLQKILTKLKLGNTDMSYVWKQLKVVFCLLLILVAILLGLAAFVWMWLK